MIVIVIAKDMLSSLSLVPVSDLLQYAFIFIFTVLLFVP